MKYIILSLSLFLSIITNAQDGRALIYNSTCNIKVPVNIYDAEILSKVTSFLDLKGFSVDMISTDDYQDKETFIKSLKEKQLYLNEVSMKRSSSFLHKKCDVKIQINELYAKDQSNYGGEGIDLSYATRSQFTVFKQKKKIKPFSSKDLCLNSLVEALVSLPYCFQR